MFIFPHSDSFLFSVKYEKGSQRSFYRDLGSIIDHLDLSAYPRDHPLYQLNGHIPDFWEKCQEKKGKLGLFKDEVNGNRYLRKLVALKPKVYCYSLDNDPDDATHKICKGLVKSTKQSFLTFEMYRTVLENSVPIRCPTKQIRSRLHHLYIEQQNRQALSLHDDKRWWVSRYHSYALGSPRTMNHDQSRQYSSLYNDHVYSSSSSPSSLIPTSVLPIGSKRALPVEEESGDVERVSEDDDEEWLQQPQQLSDRGEQVSVIFFHDHLY